MFLALKSNAAASYEGPVRLELSWRLQVYWDANVCLIMYSTESFPSNSSVIPIRNNRDLKIRRRRRQRERHKTIGLISKNNSSARALYVFVHFFAVLCKTTTWNDQIQGFVENVSTRRRIFHSPF